MATDLFFGKNTHGEIELGVGPPLVSDAERGVGPLVRDSERSFEPVQYSVLHGELEELIAAAGN